jgi:hypothetical protein
MFETVSFRTELQKRIGEEAGRSGMKDVETGIIDYLQGLASGNESSLMEREFRKAVHERRGISDALRSAEQLTREGARYALADRRTVLRLEDIQKAYNTKFCQFWPFCKS